jgi:hypothetical protein
MQLPKQCQQPDSAVSKLLENHLNVVPSFEILTEVSDKGGGKGLGAKRRIRGRGLSFFSKTDGN